MFYCGVPSLGGTSPRTSEIDPIEPHLHNPFTSVVHFMRQTNLAKSRLEKATESRNAWFANVQQLANEIDHLNAEVRVRERARKVRLNPPTQTSPALGPAWTAFIDKDIFVALSAFVVLANICVMIMQLQQSDNTEVLARLDYFFFFFYAFEIAVKALRWRSLLLFDQFHIVIWNWLDLVLVATAALDLKFVPFRPSDDGFVHGGTAGVLQALRLSRVLRLLRLTRLLKIVRLFFVSDLSWTEGQRFQYFMFLTVIANSIVMGLECEVASFFLWPYLEHLFLAIFTFELLVKLRLYGFYFLAYGCGKDAMSILLDFVVVVSGIIEQWYLPVLRLVSEILGSSFNGDGFPGMSVLRHARLLRVVRLAKLFRGIPELYKVLITMTQAMKGLLDVAILMIIFLYFCAVFWHELIATIFGGEAPEEVNAVFSSIPQTMYLLFFVANNGDQTRLQVVYAAAPVTQIFSMVFVVCGSWGMLSVVTAVVTEIMLNSIGRIDQEDLAILEAETVQSSRDKLGEMFDRLDTEHRQQLTVGKLEVLMADEMHLEWLKYSTGLNLVECKNLFKYISRIGDGKDGGPPYITRAAFIDGLQNESRSVSERTIMRLESRLVEVERVLRQGRDTSGKKKLTDCKERRRRGGAKCSTWPGNQSRSLDESSDIVCDREGHVQDAAQSDYGEAQQLRGSRGLGDEQQVE